MNYTRALVLRKRGSESTPAACESYCIHESNDRISFVNLLCCLGRKRNGESGYDGEQVLEKFFVKGAVSLTKVLSQADYPGVDALQFKVLKCESTVVNKSLLKYSRSHTAPEGRVCVSGTYPIQSRRDQGLFVAALKHHSLDDFLAPGVSLHFTTMTRINNIRTPPQFGPQAHAPTSPEYSPTSPTYSPTSPVYSNDEAAPNIGSAASPAPAAAPAPAPAAAPAEEEANEMFGEVDEEEAVAAALPPGGEAELVDADSSSESPEDDEDDEGNDSFEAQWTAIQDAQVGAARHGQRQALRGFSDELFELKETMTDETFRKLSDSLKRRHDQI